jgi:hypothetical protein
MVRTRTAKTGKSRPTPRESISRLHESIGGLQGAPHLPELVVSLTWEVGLIWHPRVIPPKALLTHNLVRRNAAFSAASQPRQWLAML